MEVIKWFEKVGYKKHDGELGSIWLSKFDDSYLTCVGMEASLKYLADRDITIELTNGVGRSETDGKWYGWSHRAIYGFEIGSKCERGDCHYTASTPEEMIDDHASFFSDISEESAAQHRAECQILDDRSGIRILHTPIKVDAVVEPCDLIDVLDDGVAQCVPDQSIDFGFSELKCGRGEWVAKTEDDAKEMATAFNEGVS